MILKYNLFATAILTYQTKAFVPSRTTTASTPLASLNSDWDNNDFLSALSGSPNDLQRANDDYEKLSGANAAKNEWLAKRSGMQVGTQPNADFLQKMGASPGGAQQPPQMAQQPPPPPPAVPQQQPQQPVQQFYDQYGNPITTMPMIYDANGNLVPFQPPVTQTQPPPPPQQQQQTTPPLPPQYAPIIEPPLPPKTKVTDTNKPTGYNADAYTISNTADVYFAQLKQDSKVRKAAWLAGDVEAANKVFQDESVKQIGNSWVENPYTKEQNVKEAKAQIEGAVRMQVLGGEEGGKGGMVSYKALLERKKKGKTASGDGNANAMQNAVQKAPNASPMAVEDTPVVSMPERQASNVGVVSTPPEVKSAPVQGMPITTQINTPSPVTTEASTPVDTEEETRKKIRTLQGLLLKQRGGPGFGAGRLRAPEAERLERSLNEVSEILRAESGLVGAATPSEQPVVKQAIARPTPQQLVSPLQPSIAAQTAPATPSDVDPIAGTVACVEAALKMYKEAKSSSEREALLLPLREAFMAAAGASNKIIAQRELNAYNDGVVSRTSPLPSMQKPPPSSAANTPTMGFPTSYNVAKAERPAQPRSPSMDSPTKVGYTAVQVNDNTQKLQDAYNALKEASGDGKFGLKNISGNEASVLASKLTEMRGILLNELN